MEKFVFQLLFDYLPILLFFIAFKTMGIYIATGVAMVTSFIQLSLYYAMHRSFEKMHVIMFLLITILGGATLLLHEEIYIKWKPTAVYWVLALVFLSTHFISKKTAIQHLLEKNIDLPHNLWRTLNLAWATFFIALGVANLYVVYHFNTNTWVNFKLFGTLGLTIIFILLQSVYLAKYTDGDLPTPNQDDNAT